MESWAQFAKTMHWIGLLFIGLGLWPWAQGLSANRGTSLLHALIWGLAAWLVWGWAFWTELHPDAVLIALSMTGCAGVAVLGARRPYVGAWNFVIVGLLAVMLLSLAEKWLLGVQSRDWLRNLFLIATLSISILNYLPTRFFPPALLVGLACLGFAQGRFLVAAALCLVLAPWAGWLFRRRKRNSLSPWDQSWLEFRDRFGVVWGLRVIEQFNQSARHAGLTAKLAWHGFENLEMLKSGDDEVLSRILDGLLRRFMETQAQG